MRRWLLLWLRQYRRRWLQCIDSSIPLPTPSDRFKNDSRRYSHVTSRIEAPQRKSGEFHGVTRAVTPTVEEDKHSSIFGATLSSRRTRRRPGFGIRNMLSGDGNTKTGSCGVCFPGLAVITVLSNASHTPMYTSVHRALLTGSWISEKPQPPSYTPFGFGMSGVASSCVCRARRQDRGTSSP